MFSFRWIRVAMQLLPLAAAFSANPAPFSIGGTVTGEDGRPIPGALLRLTGPGVASSAASRSDGSFTFEGLAAGRNQICVHVPEGGYLDRCLWETAPDIVNLSAGQNVAGLRIVLKKASTLKLRVDDPSGLYKSPSAARHILAGVFTADGRFYPLARKSTDSSGGDYELAVPFDTPLTFYALPVGLSISDGTGKPVTGRDIRVPFTHSSAAMKTQETLRIRITGAR